MIHSVCLGQFFGSYWTPTGNTHISSYFCHLPTKWGSQKSGVSLNNHAPSSIHGARGRYHPGFLGPWKKPKQRAASIGFIQFLMETFFFYLLGSKMQSDCCKLYLITSNNHRPSRSWLLEINPNIVFKMFPVLLAPLFPELLRRLALARAPSSFTQERKPCERRCWADGPGSTRALAASPSCGRCEYWCGYIFQRSPKHESNHPFVFLQTLPTQHVHAKQGLFMGKKGSENWGEHTSRHHQTEKNKLRKTRQSRRTKEARTQWWSIVCFHQVLLYPFGLASTTKIPDEKSIWWSDLPPPKKKKLIEPTNPNAVTLCRACRVHRNKRRNENTCLFFVGMTRTVIKEQQRLAGHSWKHSLAWHSFLTLFAGHSCLTLLEGNLETAHLLDTLSETLLLDTLAGHSCLTLLLDTLAWHFCWTLLLDTFAGHSCSTLFLDTLSWHSFLTLFLDTLVWHFCLTLLLDTLSWHSFLDTLAWRSCLTLLLDTLSWHSFMTLLLDTLSWHSFLTLFLDTFAWHSCWTLLLDTLAWHFCWTLLLDTLSWHCCLTFFLDTLAWHSFLTLFLDTLSWHFCLTLLLDTLSWHSFLDTLAWHSCLTLLLGTLARHSFLTLFLDTLDWHSFLTLFLDTLSWHSCLTLLFDTLAWHSCWTLFLDTLF